MAVTTITGASFTVKIGSTSYSSQVTDGTVVHTPTISRIKTLGDIAYPQTDNEWSASLNFLYDEETGLLGALNTAAAAGTGLSVEIVGGDAKWTGTMYVNGDLSTSYSADGVATCSASFVGSLTFADAP